MCIRDRNVSGVGDNAAPCHREVVCPIAVKFKEQPATMESFRANVAEGCGEHLPAIMGLTSMMERDCVLMLRKGEPVLAMPGPGGYKIEWSPGTKLLPLEHSPSGHLVIPCDEFSSVPKGNPTNEISFVKDMSHPEALPNSCVERGNLHPPSQARSSNE